MRLGRAGDSAGAGRTSAESRASAWLLRALPPAPAPAPTGAGHRVPPVRHAAFRRVPPRLRHAAQLPRPRLPPVGGPSRSRRSAGQAPRLPTAASPAPPPAAALRPPGPRSPKRAWPARGAAPRPPGQADPPGRAAPERRAAYLPPAPAPPAGSRQGTATAARSAATAAASSRHVRQGSPAPRAVAPRAHPCARPHRRWLPRHGAAAPPRRSCPPSDAAFRLPPRQRGPRHSAVPPARPPGLAPPAPSRGGQRPPWPVGPGWAATAIRAISGSRLFRSARRMGTDQRAAGHLARLRRPISASSVGATSASLPSFSAVAPPPMQQHRHRVGGVRGVRPAGRRIAHQLAVAVIGGDQQRAALLLHRGGDAAEAGIDRLHRLDRGGQAAGVADHVGVGVVQHDQVVFLRSRSPPPPCR